jgi:tetratricopeptide (TPR) repeat protein
MNAAVFATFWLVALLAGCRSEDTTHGQATLEKEGGTANRTALLPVPHPDLDRLEAAARESLRDARDDLEALSPPESGAAKLGTAYGLLGKQYHVHGITDAAEACYRNAETLAPDEFRWPYYLAYLYQLNGNLLGAEQHYERALALQPNHVPALVRAAAVQLDRDQPQSARVLFERALRADGMCAAAFVGLGKVASVEGNVAGAVESFEKALALQPEASVIHYPLAIAYRRLGDTARAEMLLRERGNRAVAIADPLIEELEAAGSTSALHQSRGITAVESGQLEVAAEEMRAAVAADPQDARARMNLGSTLAELGEREAALEQLQESLKLSPGNAKVHFNLATLFGRMGSTREEVEHYREAVRLDPGLERAQLGLANALMRSEAYQEAAAHYAEIVRLNPAHGPARLMQAMTLVRLQRYGEARARLEDALTALPTSIEIADALARLLASAPDDDVRDGRRAVQIGEGVFASQKTLDHARTLAMAYAEAGQFDRAISLQNAAIAAAQGKAGVETMELLRNDLAGYSRREPNRLPWPDGDPIFSPPSS